MNSQGLIISGADLTFADLIRILNGSSVSVDPDQLKSLQPSLPNTKETQLLSSSVYLSILTNSLLKTPALTSLEEISSLSKLLNDTSSPLALISESNQKFVLQENFKIAAELIPSVYLLSQITPLVDGIIGFSIELGNIDASIANDELFSLTTQGLKATLNNLESFLNDSKLAKKNPPTENVVELIQISGDLKDALEDAEKLIEKEVNFLFTELKKTSIKRSNAALIKKFNELISITGGLCKALNNNLEVFIINPNLRQYSELQNSFQSFQHLASELLSSSSSLLKKSHLALTEFEAKINQGGNKHRPLQLGKGSRALYQYLKENPSSDQEISQFLLNLLASKNEERRVPKIAKGMRDYASEEMKIREYVFNIIRSAFKRHMADELDTPVMELRETLTGKYGEEGSKLIYNLADQGGELLSLRYDLTVPFARYVAINRVTNWKRFQIGKVYRRDQPQMKRGRYREFYQCDFDIVGTGSNMSQEAEVLKIAVEILTQLEFSFKIKINHRKLLDSFLEISGCPSEKFRTVSSSIDKLDKEEWVKVRHELINEKGITEDCADMIGKFVKLNGLPSRVLAELKEIEAISQHPKATKAIEELANLVNYCECLGILDSLDLDMSLARGLDYYTGLVYEAVAIDGQVGSIAGGGRYDELIMRLNNSNQPTPAVGISFGVERLFTVIEERLKTVKASNENVQGGLSVLIKNNANSVLVAQAGSSERFNLIQERYKICSLLWAKGINAETSYKEKSDPKGQAGYASQQGIRWMVWVGESELLENKIKIKDLAAHSEEIIPIEFAAEFILTH